MDHQTRLPSLDGVRALAILLVIGSHVSMNAPGIPAQLRIPGWLLLNGALGVHIFFVLSGYLITHLLLREESLHGSVSLRAFYTRRFLRIMPVYYVFLVVLIAVAATTNVNIDTCQLVTSLTYTKDFGCRRWHDAHLWSLAVEEQFYLLWPPLVAACSNRVRWLVAVALILIAPVSRTLLYLAHSSNLEYSLFSNMDALMIGCLTSLAWTRWPTRLRILVRFRPSLMRLLALVSMYAIILLSYRAKLGFVTVPLGVTIQSICAAYLLLSFMLIREGWIFRVLNSTRVVQLGILSYSLYIWQQLFTPPAGIYGPNDSWIVAFPQNVVLSIIVAWLSYTFLEQPLLRLRARFRRADPDPIPAATAGI